MDMVIMTRIVMYFSLKFLGKRIFSLMFGKKVMNSSSTYLLTFPMKKHNIKNLKKIIVFIKHFRKSVNI